MSSPSRIWVTLLSLLALAVMLFAVFKLKPDILGPGGGGVASMHSPSPENDTNAAHSGNPPPAPEPTMPVSPGPGPDKVMERVHVVTTTVSGEVISYANNVLLLRLDHGEKLKLWITEKTELSVALDAGKRVKATYREANEKKIALWVQPEK